ncbi:MAG TPA: ArsR family transcriptional regulator [Janthinobacterium sp.]|jgi:DNA-binding MarR family transcriptional regulator|nr:ArsR family transcriptional regulator [Janthinobacterium sp.]
MNTERNPSAEAEQGIDPALIGLLGMLWEAQSETPDKPWSLAKISKRSSLSMSALLRHMNRLGDAGLAQVTHREEGNPYAVLTDAGRELCAAVFPV